MARPSLKLQKIKQIITQTKTQLQLTDDFLTHSLSFPRWMCEKNPSDLAKKKKITKRSIWHVRLMHFLANAAFILEFFMVLQVTSDAPPTTLLSLTISAISLNKKEAKRQSRHLFPRTPHCPHNESLFSSVAGPCCIRCISLQPQISIRFEIKLNHDTSSTFLSINQSRVSESVAPLCQMS